MNAIGLFVEWLQTFTDEQRLHCSEILKVCLPDSNARMIQPEDREQLFMLLFHELTPAQRAIAIRLVEQFLEFAKAQEPKQ